MSKISEMAISRLKKYGVFEEWELQELASKMILDLRYNIMDYCGCGCPNEVSFMIRDVLNVIDYKTKIYEKADFPYEGCYEKFNEEVKKTLGFNSENIAFEFILNALNSAELLEHGSSIGGSWLTDYGKEILCAFEIVGDTIWDVDIEMK